MVITGSCVGQYRFPVAPQYCAAKHGLVGLTRSVGEKLLKYDNIAVNCVMPGFVPTSLGSPELIAAWPQEFQTPVTSTNRAFMELIDELGRVTQDGKSDGVDGVVKSGQTVEVVGDQLFYRESVPSPNQSMDFLRAQAEEGGLWETMYQG
jgi:NAD(P)-dependent dehydrogenase (short-subunit alcohol dehydrogenase family)